MAADALDFDLNAYYSVQPGQRVGNDLGRAMRGEGDIACGEHGQRDARIVAQPLERASAAAERENDPSIGSTNRGANWDRVWALAARSKDANRPRRPMRQINLVVHPSNLVVSALWNESSAVGNCRNRVGLS